VGAAVGGWIGEDRVGLAGSPTHRKSPSQSFPDRLQDTDNFLRQSEEDAIEGFAGDFSVASRIAFS